MAYEWLIGTRYLMGTRDRAAPSIITVISVLAVSLGVTALILVLSIMGGFEGDLRTKILGSKAHILITGPAGAPIEDPDTIVALALGVEGVVGASPFVESDVMITSSTNYSGIVLRGIDPAAVATATDLPEYVQDGELAWLETPEMAIEARRQATARDIEALAGEYEVLLERLERERQELELLLDEADRGAEGSGVDELEPPDSAELERLDVPLARDGSGGRRMPPAVAGDARAAEGGGASWPGRHPGDVEAREPRDAPGILIGTELRESLHVEVGDVVHIINPDGDLGPAGPIPRSWPYRVVGVFYTGLYEYDNTVVYMTLANARALLNIPTDEVTGVELRSDDMNRADELHADVEAALSSAGAEGVEVKDWMELNSRLFSALLLEKVVMGLLLMIIVLVASFAIVCVLIMIVIQRGAEIAILRSMGASAMGILRIFVVQGFSIGAIGTFIGLCIGLALTTYLTVVGYPLEAEVYYIDRVPVEVDPVEILAVVLGALGISLLATLYPSVQAARLDPAAGLRYE